MFKIYFNLLSGNQLKNRTGRKSSWACNKKTIHGVALSHVLKSKPRISTISHPFPDVLPIDKWN